MIVRRAKRLDRGDWWRVSLSSFVYWMLVLHWIRLPHPLTIFGWPLLCLYLSCYVVLFVWLTRVALQRTRTPLPIAAPVVWTGLEFLQSHLLTGFSMGSLSHSQVGQLGLIQIANVVGAYGVTFLVMMVAATLLEAFLNYRSTKACCTQQQLAMPLLTVALLAAAWFYSQSSIAQIESADTTRFHIALIQGDTPATWDPDPNRSTRIMDRQVALSIEAVDQAKAADNPLDLIVWPESMFRSPIDTFSGEFEAPTDAHPGLVKSREHTQAWFDSLATRLATPTLVGIDHYDWIVDLDNEEGVKPLPYNSAALVSKTGKLLALYDKTHRVPFGEYIPFAESLPAMYYLTPMASGLRSGKGPVAMTVPIKHNDAAITDPPTIRVSPSICYESVIPHVIRRHVAELSAAGKSPDLLVNVTNDAWFWGASELDMHLACSTYRAIETGTPMAIAANRGLSAAISATGELLAVSPRLQETALLADIPLPRRNGPTSYVRYGDWFSGGCLLLCSLLLFLACRPACQSARTTKSIPPANAS